MFNEAREVFKRISLAYTQHPQSNAELENALKALVETYDTAIHENRFVVGGATEMLVCAWLRSLGLSCLPRSVLRTDLEVEGVAFSVKANFASSSSIRLINVLGDSPSAHWQEPALVLLAEEGLFYVDPALMPKDALRRKPDVLELKTSAVRNLKDTEWHLSLEVPRKPQRDETAASRVASRDVARSVLELTRSQVLLQHFPER